jgi:anti-sigma regulatory factor (Ser/Thr protein kinase)
MDAGRNPERHLIRRPVRAEYVLPAEAASARWARRLTEGFLCGSPVRAEWADGAGLVVSELVTNAVRHGGGRCRLRLTSQHDDMTVEVHDSGTGIPARAPRPEPAPDPESGPQAELEPESEPVNVDELEESGRGLLLVRCLSRRLHTVPNPRGGKTVRAVLALR